jgi:ABC-type transporter Mla maintaining outer membrane lipid asymmetry permease subunit MlaE
MPPLTAIFGVIGLFGAQLIGVQMMGIDAGVSVADARPVRLHDVPRAS